MEISRNNLRKNLIPALAFVAFYFASFFYGCSLSHLNYLFWTATGLTIGFFWRYGFRYWLLALGCGLIANLCQGAGVAFSASMSICYLLESLLGAMILRWIFYFQKRFEQHTIVLATLACGLFAPVLGAFSGAFSLKALGLLPNTAFWDVVWEWWKGSGLGIAFLVPLFFSSYFSALNLRKNWKKVLLVMVLAPTGFYAVFFFSFSESALVLSFIVLYIVCRSLPAFEARIISLLYVVLAIHVTLQGGGPFFGSQFGYGIVHLQLHLAVFATTMLFLTTKTVIQGARTSGIILGLGLITVSLMTSQIRKGEISADAAHFQDLVTDAESRLKVRISFYEEFIKGAAALVQHKQNLSVIDWDKIVTKFNLPERYPALDGLGLIRSVSETELAGYLKKARQRIRPDFALKGYEEEVIFNNTAEHFIVELKAPMKENEKLLGLDMAIQSDPREALILSRKLNEPVLTKFIQDVREKSGTMVQLFFFPVLDDTENSKFVGWVYAPLLTGVFFKDILGTSGRELDLRVFGSQGDSSFTVYGTNNSREMAGVPEKQAQLAVGKRALKIGFYRSNGFNSMKGHFSSWVEFTGLFIFLLIAALVSSLEEVQKKAKDIADEQTKMLRETEQILKDSHEQFVLAIEGANEGLWDWRLNPPSLYLSPRWKEILGYPENCDFSSLDQWMNLIHMEDAKAFRDSMEAYLLGLNPFFESEHRLFRHDGTYAWILAKGKALRDQDGKAYRMVGSISDISRRKEVEVELLKANREAQKATKAKSEFLANMSHEIRTPMNGILGMARLLMDSPNVPEEQKNQISIIFRSCESLLRIVNDVLDFSKIEANKIQIQSYNVDLIDELFDMIELMKFRAREKGIDFQLKADEDFIRSSKTDPIAIRQVLTNLLGNAIKFTDHGAVELELSSEKVNGRQILHHFWVRDTGMGISDSEVRSLFVPFTQVESGLNKKQGGTGLGLAISRGLVEAMGGRIGIVSELGGGSEFSFSIVALELDGPLARKRSSGQKLVEQFTQNRPDISILVADDNEINLTVATKFLKKIGYESDTVTNGAEALLATKAKKYDLILMDHHMPLMDGVEATIEIRKLFPTGGPKILAVTASVIQEEVDKCIRAGMDGFVGKPIKLEDLIQAIDKLFPRGSFARLPKDAKVTLIETSTPQATIEPDGLVNWALVLKNLDDDEALLKSLVDGFLKKIDDKLTELSTATNRGSAKEVGLVAHFLKGLAANFYVEEVRNLCGELEKICKTNVNAEDTEVKVKAVEKSMLKLKEDISSWEQKRAA